MRDDVWFAIPSASIARARDRLPAWRDMGYRVAVLQNREQGEIPADRVIWRDTYPGWAESVNILCREVVPSDAPVVVTGGDDMLPDPDRAARELLDVFYAYFPESFGVMQPVGDPYMNAREYCGSPWLGREWIDRAYAGQGPLWGGYRHNWADHELHWVARSLDVLQQDDTITQQHEHFTRTGEATPHFWKDEVASHDQADVELFIARLWQGFPGHAPLHFSTQHTASWWREHYPGLAERYWISRYAGDRFGGEAEQHMTAALQSCADRNLKRIAIYGAGTETRTAAHALMNPPVNIVCIIDDDPRLRGQKMWGFPVKTLDQILAAPPNFDALIISARAAQEHLANRAAPLTQHGIEIISIHPCTTQREVHA